MKCAFVLEKEDEIHRIRSTILHKYLSPFVQLITSNLPAVMNLLSAVDDNEPHVSSLCSILFNLQQKTKE